MAIDLEFDEGGESDIEFDQPVRRSLAYGVTKNPDQHARIVSLAERERLPVDVVERNQAEAERRSARPSISPDEIEFDLPASSKALSDPDTAAMAHDDLDNLTALERIYQRQQARTLGARHARALERGALGLGVTGEGIATFLDRAVSSVGRALLPKPRGVSDEQWTAKQERLDLSRGVGGLTLAADAYLEVPQDEKITAFGELVERTAAEKGTMSAISEGVRYLTQNLSVLSVLLAEQLAPMGAAGPIGGAVGLSARPLVSRIANEAVRRYAERSAVMAGIQFSSNMVAGYGPAIAEGLEKDLSVDAALTRARDKTVAEAGVNALFSLIPTGGGGRAALAAKEMAKQAPAGAAGAAAGAAAVGEDISLSELMLEFFGEFTTAPIDIATAGLLTHRDRAERMADNEQNRALAASIEQMQLDELTEVAKANKLGGRGSERFQGFMQSLDAQYGPDRRVFIDGDQVAEVIDQLDQEAPAVQEMRRQLEQGGDISLGLGDYLADVARTAAGATLRPFVRMSEDGMSQREVEEAAPRVSERIQEMMARAEADAGDLVRIDEFTDQIYDQLVATGRVSPQVARMSSQIIPAYVATRARQYNLTVDEMIEKLGFGGVAGPDGTVGTAMRKPEAAPGALPETLEQKAEYFGAHRPMTVEGGASPLTDLTDAFGEDIYTDNALQFFGSGDPREAAVLQQLQALRGDPNATVTIYRGVPSEVADINAGDWVTLSEEVAQDYAELLGGQVVAKEVPAAHVTSWADSLLEFGYYPPEAAGQTLSQFAGPRARTADKHQLSRAVEMADAGWGLDAIRRETGWHKGADGLWRFEISDDQARLTTDPVDGETYRLGDLLEHEQLYAAYPDMADRQVSFDLEEGEGAYYSPRDDEIHVARDFPEGQLTSTLLHEIQHAIQEREDFARGGAPEKRFTDAVKEAVEGLARASEDERAAWQWANQWQIDNAEQIAEVARNGLKYESLTRLMEYANRDKPSGVFRLIRNESQWIYDESFRGDPRANELQYRFYDIPKRGPKRNAYLRDLAADIAQLLRDSIPQDQMQQFRNDERTMRGMLNALQREASKARAKLEPLRFREREARQAAGLAEATRFKSPMEVYRALAGEVEARTTQARMDLTAEERAARPPQMDMDTRPEEALVILGGRTLQLPAAMSAPGTGTPAQEAAPEEKRHQIPMSYIVKTKARKKNKPTVLKALNEGNLDKQTEALDALARKHSDPLRSAKAWLDMERDMTGDTMLPPPPYGLIDLYNDATLWSAKHSQMTAEQVAAAGEGFAVVEEFKDLYASGDVTAHTTGQLMLWGMLSRMLSTHPHESAFVDAATDGGLDDIIQTALDREWTDADVDAYLDWVKGVIPDYAPGKQGTSNLNDFGKVFLKKMSKRMDDGRSALEHLHDMIADPTIPTATIRRRFYTLAGDVGIKNKVLSFVLLLTGRDDVIVLDRIQINSMWDTGRYGKLMYDDVAPLFEGAQGLARYEALERSLLTKIGELYEGVGRPEDASVGRYHWESWVLNSGQVVAHPTIQSLVDQTLGKESPFADIGAPEGRFHQYAFGSIYARSADGTPYIIYNDSKGDAYTFGLKEFKDFLTEVKKPATGVVPTKFSVKTFRDLGYPWYESGEVNRERLDQIIQEKGERATPPAEQGADADVSRLEQPAFHGTPHQFDRFSLEAIGTGEGAQAYGWGLYFASKRGVAEWYREALTSSMKWFVIDGGKHGSLRGLFPEHHPVASAAATSALKKSGADIDAAIEIVNGEIAKQDPAVPVQKNKIKLYEGSKEILSALKGRSVEMQSETGQIYQVDIPESDLLLDWDKPLDDQGSKTDAVRRITDRVHGGGTFDAWAESQEGGDFRDWKDNLMEDMSDQEISEALNAEGIPGLRYLDGTARGTDGDSYNYVIWDEDTVTIEAVNDELRAAELAQEPQEPTRRARALFDIQERTIQLLEQSDPSSFIHESGHLFLEMEKQLAAEFGVTDQQKQLLEWLGVEAFDQVRRGQHEQFARGFEAYTYEGKAPSRALASAFAAFRRWMLEIYKRMARLNVTLTPEVREFFDHMLATDEQIAEVRGNPAYDQYFKDIESAGMTEAEWAEYQRRQQASKDKATQTLEEKVLARLRRQYTKEWKAEKSELIEEEKSELQNLPVYQASAFMRARTSPGASAENKLNPAAVRDIYDGKIPPQLLSMVSNDSDLTPDEVALDFGYATGEEMLNDIIETPSVTKAAEAAAEEKMIAKHGDILNDGTIEEEAREAAQNEDKAAVLLMELNALAKQTGTALDIDREALKAGAARTIAAARVKDLRPGRFYRAEIRSAQKAATALQEGDLQTALEHKTQQLANHYLYREALVAREQAVKMRRHMGTVRTRKYDTKAVDPEYVHQMKILAAAYDFGTTRRDADQAKQTLLNLAVWIDSQMTGDNWVIPQFMDPTLSEMIAIRQNDALEPHEKAERISRLQIPRYDEMTVEQLQGVYDMARNLRYVGGRLSTREAEAFRELTEQTAASIIEQGKGPVRRPQEQSTAYRAISALKQFGAEHVVLGNRVAQLDGYQNFGPLFEAFYQQILDSTNAELALKRQVHDQLAEIFAKIPRRELTKGFREKGHAGYRTITKSNGERWSLSRRGRIMLALYWGSPESRDALFEGSEVSETDALRMIGTLTGTELDMVESLWKLNESLWPQVRDTALRMTGVAPPKVEHVPYTVNGREMPGGYMRLYYDYDARDSYLADVGESGNLTRSGGHVMKNTRHGARNARVGSGGRPVSFEMDNIFRALDENIHDIAFAETARDTNRFLQSTAIRNAIVNQYGKEIYESMGASVEGIIAGNFASNHPVNTLLRYLRTNASYAMLGYSIRNLMQQPVALTNVFGKIGEKYTLKGLAEFVFKPMSARHRVEWIQERSEFMRQRTSLVNRETAEISNRLNDGLLSGPLKRHAFDLQTMGDAMVAYPAWYGAYLQGTEQGMTEKQATTYADEMVAQTIGSGLMKDLSPMLQGSGQLKVVGPEMLKSITFMGSFFNKVANLTRDAYRQNDLKTVRGQAEFTRQMTWYLLAPAVVSALIVDNLPDEEDDEGWLEWAAMNMVEYGLAQIFGLRDMVYLWNGFTPSTPYTRAVTEAGRTVKLVGDIATGEKELDAELAAKLTRNVSAFVPIPGAGQAARTIEGAVDAAEGNDRNLYQMLVEGKER